MEEAFLHFVWQYGFFDQKQLQTTAGAVIQVLQRGILNTDSGPDFSDARVVLGGQVWFGNVELHLRSSDWYRHGHEQDPAYDNTVLHVVYEHDLEVISITGSCLPCLELKGRIPENILGHYEELHINLEAIPCSRHHPAGMERQVMQMMHRTVVERVIKKTQAFREIWHSVQQDWQSAFYIYLCRYLGFKVNADAMENLARVAPLTLVQRNRDSLLQVEALLFGQAGMLEAAFADDYYKALQKEYRFLRHKHRLVGMQPASWKFMRMRPLNFPTMRIAQLAAILQREVHLFSRLLEATSVVEMRSILSAVASDFWRNHYHFAKPSAQHTTSLGKSAVDGLLINVVAVALFAYGDTTQNEEMKEKALDLLGTLEPENNQVTRRWQDLGFRNSSAYDSQALLGLLELYCRKRLCLHCAIGQKILVMEKAQ